jgi:hypothetical protein
MNTTDFNRWCETAVSGIRFKPDRAQVYDELYAHLEDRCADMTDAGVSEDEAVKRTLEAMGSASEVAEQLEQIHRPFWGRLLRFSRWLLLIAAVMAAFIVLPWLRGLALVTPGDLASALSYYGNAEGFDTNHAKHLWTVESAARDSSDGYRFTLRRADGWLSDRADVLGETEADSVDLTVECFNLRPWARYSSVQYEFYAVDSLGNRYEAFPDAWRDGSEPMLLWTGNINTGVCTVTHICSLMGYCSQGAEWIELRYDRAGRDVRLRVYLPGGDAA